MQSRRDRRTRASIPEAKHQRKLRCAEVCRGEDGREHSSPTCLAMVYSSMSGSRVWWNMSGSSVESDTLSPTEKNSWNGDLDRRTGAGVVR